MQNNQHRFNLHLPGLLKVLAEHLYSTKKVGLRELIQNAHDSCLRRKIEEADPHYRPRIDLALDPDQRLVTIRDNGSGLTAEEINDYLATIGRGYTRELREKLALTSSAEAAELIGQFGLGFLAAFLLAEDVTLTTRSFRGSQALRWHSRGDEYYEVTPLPSHEVGTTVQLKIKPAAAFILREQNLIEAVRTYADLLPIPIYLAGESLPLNLMTPPWEGDQPEEALRDYIARVYQTKPLWVLPLSDGKVKLVHDSSITVPLRGFLFVPPASIASVREYGDLTVYIRRMFICEGERDLLPGWARFVRGVIECPALQPTAAREGLHQDASFESVRQLLEEQLSVGLRELSRRDPATWRALVRGHADVITSWAVKDSDFFERVEDLVCFRTTRGLMTLPEYLKTSGGTLYYVSRELGSLQDQLLAEGRDVPALDASWFAVAPFLEKYAARHPDVGLVQLDGAAEELLRPVAEGMFAPLLAYYRTHGIRARIASFKPADVPAMMVYPAGAETAREASQAVANGELPGPLAGLVNEYVEQWSESPKDFQGTLYLNANCPLIRRLVEKPPRLEQRDALLTVLHQMARLFCGRLMNAADAAQAYGTMTRALEAVVQ